MTLRFLRSRYEIAASCVILGTFEFLPGFMTCLIQWGHKPSKNSKSVENHIFRGRVALKVLLYYQSW